MRSTRIGVYIMPTPAANMPMQRKNSMSSHIGGCGSPIQTMAWISTPIAHAGDGRRRRLDVVRAVLAREHLAADEESDGEVHVRGGDATERSQHECAEREQERVVLPRPRRGQ